MRRGLPRPDASIVAPRATLVEAVVDPLPRLTAPVVVATADPALRRMLSFALDQVGLLYRPFDSGTTLLETLLSAPTTPHPTVVVLDADLPGIDGQAILERLNTARPDAYLIVVLSSHADESVQVRSLLSGALDHLAKPFNIRVLMVKVQRWVAVARRCEVAA